MADDNIYSKMAHHEVGWWQAHHRKDKDGLTEQMTKLYVLQFGVSYGDALEAVGYRVQATKEHDLAEEFEDKGDQVTADKHWREVEKLLTEHFKILGQKIESK